MVVPRTRPVVSLLSRMRENERVLAANYDAVMALVDADQPISPGAEWFVDNFHSIEKQVRMVRRDLPRSYFDQLPKLGPGFLEGHPRIFSIMWAYVAHTDSLLDQDQLARYIQAYDSREPLEIGELWAAAINLRVLLVENARRLSTQIVAADRERKLADEVADALLGIGPASPKSLDDVYPAWRTTTPALSFAVQLLRRLTEAPAEEAFAWIRASLIERDLDAETAVQRELAKQSQATLTMRNIITSMKRLDDVDWETWIEAVSLVEQELRRSPGYLESDFATRNSYRTTVERLARGSDQSELTVTRRALKFASEGMDEIGRHVGYWFIDDGLPILEDAVGYRPKMRERVVKAAKGAGIGGYVTAILLSTLLLTALATWGIAAVWANIPLWQSILLGVLLALPVSDFVVARLGTRLTRLIPTVPLAGLGLEKGIPESLRTVVVVPTMITSPGAVAETIETLETHFLGNDSGEIYFAAATDWADAPQEQMPGDLELLDEMRRGIKELNATYGQRFFLFHRERRWNESEGTWMGWERKRGKLEELNQVLRGETDTSITAIEGRLPGPFRYVITLDADTQLPRVSAKRLVGKIAHPLNTARFGADGKRVIRGYTILQPRVTPSLPTVEETSRFQMLYSTRQGLDPYTFAVADLYQDLFGEGSFAGKGVYDIAALERSLAQKIPENSVLSHDLLEGNYSRSGYASDVEVVEEHPTSYAVHVSRTHRWTRGDWQLLPWIFGRPRRDMTGLGTWKMLDNLRRSLSPISSVIAIIVGAILLPLGPLATWIGVILATMLLPLLIPPIRGLFSIQRGYTVGSQLRASLRALAQNLSVGLLDFSFLTHNAASMADAIARTIWRMFVSKKYLLEWTTAAAAGQSAKGTLEWFMRTMAGGLLAPAVLLIVGIVWYPALWAVLPVVILWLLAPVLAWWVSRPLAPVERALSPEVARGLRGIARRTWRYFEVFVTPEDSDLPPDNFQEDPGDRIAHRTSPTNIGMYYLSAVAARDLGWIGMADVTDRLMATMRTQISLDHHEGHLYNWYDTKTTRVLEPRYVSSVDSGNLAGHLLVLANACAELAGHDPRIDNVRTGIHDAIDCVLETPTGAKLNLTALRAAVDSVPVPVPRGVDDAYAGTPGSVVATPGEATAWAKVISVVDGLLKSLPVNDDAADWLRATASSVRSRIRDLALTDEDLAEVQVRLRWVEAEARRSFTAMDFGLVFDEDRMLLSVGYNPDRDELDESTYDMLASECRLASFVAIAKADLRTRHWGRLARGLTSHAGRPVLQSWSGSMFEYLMPALVMRSPAGGLLDTTLERVVRRQIEYGSEQGVPWGISESAYNARDKDLNYQYGPFGTPGLGVVRGLADNLVVAPYATGLATMVDPDAALSNYKRLRDEVGALGRYGFYEAVDFTAERLPRGEKHAVVRNYMAHHSGMTIVAIHNILAGAKMRDWFHQEPMVRASDLLLHEAEPRVAPKTHARTDELDPSRKRQVRAVTPPAERRFSGEKLATATIGALSNGRLSLTATPAGSTLLRWNGLTVTRWDPDRTTEESGSVIYVRNRASGELHTPTDYPLCQRGSGTHALFAEDSLEFTHQERNLTSKLEHHISPEADAYSQTLTIRNLSNRDVDLDVISACELALNRRPDDDAHPAFSKMFVYTHATDDGVVYATRRRRSSSDPEVWVAQFITGSADPRAVGPDPDDPILIETDGRKLIGRGRSLRDPAILDRGNEPSGTVGYVMEPVISLKARLRVPATGRGQLTLWTVVAETEEEARELVDTHRASGAYDRLTALAWSTAQGQLRHLGITPSEGKMFQTLVGNLVYPDPAMRSPVETLGAAASQASLWELGISGDLPIMVVRIENEVDIDLVRQAVRAFEYWRLRRIAADVVLLADRNGGYLGELDRTLKGIAQGIHARTGNPDSTGNVYVVRQDLASPAAMAALFGAASIVLVAKRGDLADQLFDTAIPPLAKIETKTLPIPGGSPELPAGLAFVNGYGGFTEDGREYVVVTDSDHPTPAPWTNVVANEQFGFHATAEGAGYTWWRNSRDNQLTPWQNKPIESPVSEVLYVRDMHSGTLASMGSAPVPGGRHVTRHGFGYTTYSLEMDGVEIEQTMFVPLEDPVKVSIVKLQNNSAVRRTLRLAWYGEPVLGNDRYSASRHLITELDDSGALVVRNPWSPLFAGQVAFVDMDGLQDSWTGNRTEFIGRQGTLAAPHGIAGKGTLSGRTGPGLDPCLAMTREVTLRPGDSAEVVITFGAAASREEVSQLVVRYRERDPSAALADVRAHWDRTLGNVQVRTPDPSFDVVMNGWLLYQTLACRMTARSGYYQASGAFGFRDQLQDSMTAVLVDPEAARTHLLTAAGRQFREGDVQHWWLPATGDGIRTRISDDVVWLAFVAAHYVKVTGDHGVLDEQVPFLEGPELEPGEPERYFRPGVSSDTVSLYEHCLMALRRAMNFGFHGLPLMGTGDWNDGMNRVGAEGRGESVWLGWFLVTTLDEFCRVAAQRGDRAVIREFTEERKRLVDALEAEGWDGDWYRRGYFDDGTPLGSASRTECRIDAIAQSWAVLSGRAQPERARMAMEAVQRELVAPEDRLLRLFTPPFDVSEPDPGYIRAYPPGVRENGGQYTHGALWAVFAWSRLGRPDLAMDTFSLINPVNHALNREDADEYVVEPYVVAADVYSVAPYNGKGGWTWYTGSAGWMYRAGLEAVLGIERRPGELVVRPGLPPAWDSAEVVVRHGDASTVITLRRGAEPGDGTPRPAVPEHRLVVRNGVRSRLDATEPVIIPLEDDGTAHHVEIWGADQEVDHRPVRPVS